MRIAVIHVAHETNDFNPILTTLSDYQVFGILEGPAIFDTLRGFGQIGGHLAAVEAAGPDVVSVPLLRAWAGAGGRIDAEAFRFFADRIRALLAGVGPLDGLSLQLHGACAAEGIDDVEGEQLALCREILGPNVPIVLELDHHANVTRRMVELSTAIVAHRTQPHDPYDTGLIGAELLIRLIRERIRPAVAWRKIPLLTHQEQFLTAVGPMKRWFDHARALERDPRVLHVANFPMQPWLDVVEGGWSTAVVTSGDQGLAERLADEMADLAWSLRDAFQVREAIGVDEAVRRADAAPRGVVVLSDTGDTVFGGAAGDSNLLLEAMLRLGIKGPALVPLISPTAAATLTAAGEGRKVTLPLGGDAAVAFFRPIEVTGTVRRIGGGTIRLDDYNHQPLVDIGSAAVFDVGPVTVLVTERRGVAGNVPGAYRALGVDPANYKMAVLKTASNFQYFAPLTSQLIRVDTKGPGQSDIMSLPWRRIPRPIHPLDPVPDWRHAGVAAN